MVALDEKQQGSTQALDEDVATPIRCKSCRAAISRRDRIFSKDGRSPLGAYANPQGYLRELITVREAWGLDLAGWATAEFTWFQGYTWRIASCIGCGSHVGWKFEAVDAEAPAEFFGLLTAAIEGA